jgi:hypothetical protein
MSNKPAKPKQKQPAHLSHRKPGGQRETSREVSRLADKVITRVNGLLKANKPIPLELVNLLKTLVPAVVDLRKVTLDQRRVRILELQYKDDKSKQNRQLAPQPEGELLSTFETTALLRDELSRLLANKLRNLSQYAGDPAAMQKELASISILKELLDKSDTQLNSTVDAEVQKEMDAVLKASRELPETKD